MRPDAPGTTRYRDSTGGQDAAGYSRAVRRGQFIAVSGTTAHGPEGALFPGDTRAQTLHCLERVIAAVTELGGSEHDIVRTRLLLSPEASWQDACTAHGERFTDVLPANSTYVVAALIGTGFLVEIEADAVLLG